MTVIQMQAKLETMQIKKPEQPSITKRLKIVTLPLPAKFFTGRDEYLKTIETSFDFPKTSLDLGEQRRFVLHGTGGMGKTQLALKFLDEHRDKYVN